MIGIPLRAAAALAEAGAFMIVASVSYCSGEEAGRAQMQAKWDAARVVQIDAAQRCPEPAGGEQAKR